MASIRKRSKIDEYRAAAARWKDRAKKTRNRADREWQICLARAYLILAEAEAERRGRDGSEAQHSRDTSK
jgi:hypothetical protein